MLQRPTAALGPAGTTCPDLGDRPHLSKAARQAPSGSRQGRWPRLRWQLKGMSAPLAAATYQGADTPHPSPYGHHITGTAPASRAHLMEISYHGRNDAMDRRPARRLMMAVAEQPRRKRRSPSASFSEANPRVAGPNGHVRSDLPSTPARVPAWIRGAGQHRIPIKESSADMQHKRTTQLRGLGTYADP